MISSPKELFLRDSAKTKAHADLMERLEEAIHVAFNEYAWELAQATKGNPVDAANAQFRQAGAQDFIATLTTLHVPGRSIRTPDNRPLHPPS